MNNATKRLATIGEYRLLQLIGRGGMGEVWLAARKGVKKPCALKVLLPQFCANEDYRRRFFREAEIMASLRHARIVPVFDFGEADGRLYLAMEYIDGTNLRTLVEAVHNDDRQLPMGVVAYVMGEILEALRHAHNRSFGGEKLNITHRDVTPRNVLISSEGEVMLTDFGIALRDTDVSVQAFGTLQYMAPEQALGKAERRSDLYSACGVLHFMLTGEPPRRMANLTDFQDRLFDDPTPLARGDVPASIELLRTKGLQPEVPSRLGSAHDGLVLLSKYDGFRSHTTSLADIYRLYIGPPRSGWTGMVPVADSGTAHEAADEVTTSDGPANDSGPKPRTQTKADSAEQWYRRWADTGAAGAVASGQANDANDGEIEADAPRIFRRRRSRPPAAKAEPIPKDRQVRPIAAPRGETVPLDRPAPTRKPSAEVVATVQLSAGEMAAALGDESAAEPPPTPDEGVLVESERSTPESPGARTAVPSGHARADGIRPSTTSADSPATGVPAATPRADSPPAGAPTEIPRITSPHPGAPTEVRRTSSPRPSTPAQLRHASHRSGSAANEHRESGRQQPLEDGPGPRMASIILFALFSVLLGSLAVGLWRLYTQETASAATSEGTQR